MGATVLDNCMNVGALKDKRYDEIKQEFKEYVEAAQGVMTKMIIEVCYLTDDEIRQHVSFVLRLELTGLNLPQDSMKDQLSSR